MTLMSAGSDDRDDTVPRLLAGAPWLRSPELAAVFAALSQDAGKVRVVGGSVRNALAGHAITDIDLATPLLPEDVMRRAGAADLGVHPTGLDHGTVTLVANGVPFEVTTLRRDVETDGRRAVVAFTQDWREDASRRDFTMNALYADAAGHVFDYFGGLADLSAGRVRFIGDAHARIREDYLRILRFFRFNAEYGRGELDATGLDACADLKDGMARLSAERIGNEMMKLIAAPRAAEVVAIMSRAGILAAVLGPSTHPERLSKLQAIESAAGFAPDRWTRLAALALDAPGGAGLLASRLRLSNADAEKLAGAAAFHPALAPSAPEPDAKALLYRAGADAYRRAALVAWARSDDGPASAERRARASLAERWTAPAMPVRGADVLALGVQKGAQVGRILERFEAWWMAADFPGDPALHKEKLRELVDKDY